MYRQPAYRWKPRILWIWEEFDGAFSVRGAVWPLFNASIELIFVLISSQLNELPCGVIQSFHGCH